MTASRAEQAKPEEARGLTNNVVRGFRAGIAGKISE